MATSSPGRVAGGLDAGHQHLQRLLVGAEVRGEAALVADAAAQAAVVQRLLQRVEDLGPHAQALREARRADGHDHELLEIDRVVGVGAAVEDVHHGHREHVRGVAAQVAPQRLALLGRRGVRGRQGDAEDRVGPQARLVGRAVEVDERAVEALLVGGVAAADRLGDLAVDVADRLRHALAAVGLAAVAQLGGLELAGRGAAGHDRAPGRAGAQHELDLDRRVAATVEHLPGVDLVDLAHSFNLAWT
jgi:hypothetical protein